MAKFLSREQINQLKAREQAQAKAQERLPRTPEQIDAIYSNGTNILVSASAGSGKTFVMVERILDMLKRGIAISQLFISTFTVKAAGELRERIEAKLTEELAKTKDQALRQHLSQQLADLPNADISTMDAFTQRLVNTYGYVIGVSPNFRIMTDPSEQAALKEEIYADLFDSYRKGSQAAIFNQAVRNFTGSRKDSSGFKEVVYAVHSFSQSTAHPEQWLKDTMLAGYQEPFEQQVEDFLAPHFKEQDFDRVIDEAQKFFSDHVTAVRQEFKKSYKYLEQVDSLIALLADLDTQADLEQLGKQLAPLRALKSSLTMRIGASKDELLKAFASDYNTSRPKVLEPFVNLLNDLETIKVLRTYQDQAQPILEILRNFVADFSKQYLERKKQESAFEFTDIAHLAIQILESDQQIRDLYVNRYHEVMVDEYQDNNQMQERLLDLLSNGHNRFMVGDIKQSIYRFRQADPMIFRSKFDAFDQADTFDKNSSQGLLILLKENFRSHIEVLEATNAVFTRLMDKEIGEIDYDRTHMLVAGNAQKSQPKPDNRMQVWLYDEDSQADLDQDQVQDLPALPEIEMVIKEISRLHEQEGVPYDDITLLVETRTRNDQILDAFARHSIPIATEDTSGHYLKSLEIMIMMDTLRTINNPLRDESLVALLKSPMFAFGEDALTRISLQASRGNFYEKLSLALDQTGNHPELVTKELHHDLTHFQEVLTNWRSFAKTHSIHDLIWKIYRDRFYYDYAGSLVNGEQRQANLYALTLRAHQFEQTGFKGLPRFIRMIDRIIASDNDLADVDVALPKDAVQLMTAHQSKGLEFPYVFILNLDKSFNKMDESAPIILDRQKGIGIKYAADVRNRFESVQVNQVNHVKVSLDTLPYQLNRRRLHRAALSEEMRLLYVAMTRAETKLYLIGKGSRQALSDKYRDNRNQERLATKARDSWNSFQDWILALAQNFPEADLAFDLDYQAAKDLIAVEAQAAELAIPVDDTSHNRQSDQIAQALDALEAVEVLNQRYQAAINLPTVRTPSQIKKFYQPVMEDEGLDIMQKPVTKADFALPQFTKTAKITGADIGSATHELMQRLDLKPDLDLSDLERALEQVEADPAVKKKIALPKLLTFFTQDPLGQEILEQSARVVREAPFAMLHEDAASGEQMVIRGIVDGFIRYDDHIVLFDYKTDRYQDPQELVDRYQDQMSLYAKALQQSYGISRIDKYLILLGGQDVQVQALKP